MAPSREALPGLAALRACRGSGGDAFVRPLASPSKLGEFPWLAPSAADEDMTTLGRSEWPTPLWSKVLLVAPHPDDETLAAGGLIQRILKARGVVRIVYATNGDGYLEAVQARTQRRQLSAEDFQRYGRQRQAEAIEAQLELGVPPAWLKFLGFPDGGIRALWGRYWCSPEPYVSPFTLQSQSPQGQGLQYRGTELEEELVRILFSWQPTIVILPDPRDLHTDHCALGGFVLDAVREARRRGATAEPKVLGYLVHFPSYPGDPSWRQAVKRSGVCGSEEGMHALSNTTWLRIELDQQELRSKESALWKYTSQVQIMRSFLEQFARSEEWFSVLQPKHWRLPRIVAEERKPTSPPQGCSVNGTVIGTSSLPER